MKRISTIVCGFASLIAIHASLESNAQTTYSASAKVNYIRLWEPNYPETDEGLIVTKPMKDVRLSTQYFDGLGRPLQTVIRQGSLATGDSAFDLVTSILYDEAGREQFKYLPFPSNSTGGNTSTRNGNFKTNPFQQQATFYQSQFGSQGETYYYAQTAFEPSPMSRPTKVMAAGNSWVGANRGVETKFWTNSINDSVRIWNVTDNSGGFGTYSTDQLYAVNTLYKTVTVNEHGKQVIEFRDLEGNVILKKVQLTATADIENGSGYTGWLCTYYIYDHFNNLRCVVQPAGTEYLSKNNWQWVANILDEQCFRYEYDHRHRPILKKVPGAGNVYLIYDSRDRIVMTQDSLLRSKHQWLYTKFDDLNRPDTTGLITDNSNYNNPSFHQAQALESTEYPLLASYSNEILTQTFYDSYSWRSGESNPLSAQRSTVLDSHLLTPSDTQWPYPQNATLQSGHLYGLTTGTKAKVLQTSGYIYTINFYDNTGRVIQVQSNNISGGSDIQTNQFNWAGQNGLTVTKHEKNGDNSQESIVVTKTSFDSLFRAIKVEKKISNSKVNNGNMPSAWTVISQLQYDALGQVKKRKLGNTPVDSLTYDYNIRGWMLGANRDYVKNPGGTNNWFGFDLGYDKPSLNVGGGNHNYVDSQYNGNIVGMLWKSTGDDQLRKYDFGYDAKDRLLKADFTQFTSGSFNLTAGLDFSVKMGNGTDPLTAYDANGNILRMNQQGWKISGSETIDSLLYTYVSNSNKLLNVLDRRNDTATRLGDFRSSKAYMDMLSQTKTTSATDYSYNGNGNLILDKNKDIGNIHYNHLNLPDSITVTGKGHIKYVYDAGGNKLKKEVTEGSKVTTTLYLLGNYVNDTLQFIGTEEGRARPDDSVAIVYDYFVKDHLGNVRMLLTEQRDTSFYPVASLETASLDTQQLFYSGLDTGRINKNEVPGYPNDTYTNPNNFVQQLSGSGAKIGAGIVLKVMAGDRFNLRANSWYKKNGVTPGSPGNPFDDLLNALSEGVSGVSAGKAKTSQLVSSSPFNGNIADFLNDQTYNSTKPKAYVNWMLFDEQFKYDSASSGFEQVGDDQAFTTHTRNNLTVTKSGYLYIYVSNVTPNISVFFDNVQVTHIRGPLLEETHYYPFGLTMAGICSKALSFGEPKNKEKTFQGQRFDDDLGVNYIQFKYRSHDPQIGRFIQIDPLADDYEYNSTYAFSENKVTAHVELEGLESLSFHFMYKDATPEQKKSMRTQDIINAYSDGEKKGMPIVLVGLALLTPGPDELLIAGLFAKGIRIVKSADAVNDTKKAIDKLDDLKDLAKGLEKEKGQLEKSKNSFEKLIKEHKEKLDEFKKDPVGKSDPKLLEGKSKEVQQKIIDGRVKALEKQIKKQEGELNKTNQKLNEVNKKIDDVNKQTNGTQ